jgi:hypothetical protein
MRRCHLNINPAGSTDSELMRVQAKRVRLVLTGREIGIGEFGIYDEQG